MVAFCALVLGQGGGAPRADTTRREVARFDFEELEYNPDPVPQFWFRAQDDPGVPRARPGFPRFNEAAFDHTMSASGGSSVLLPTQGGSTSLRLMAGTIPVFPEADYTVTAKIRTRGLKHARAAISARLLRDDRTPIAESERRSELVFADGTWRTVSVTVSSDYAGAAFLQLDLELLQASQFGGDEADAPGADLPGRIAFEDIRGGAWFDDVSVDLIPRARLRTLSPGNLVPGEQRPELEYRIRDLVAQSLTARLRVRDADGKVVAERTGTVNSDDRTNTWTPELPGFGAYRAELEIAQGDRVVDTRAVAFVWSSPPTRTLGPIGLMIERPSGAESGWDAFVPAAVRTTGAGAVWMSMPATIGSPAAAIIEETLATGAELTLAVPAGTSSATPDGERKEVVLLDALDRFGQRVTRWALIDGGDEKMRALLHRFVPGPVVSTVRTPSDASSVDRADSVALRVPASVAPENLPDVVAAWLESVGGAPTGGLMLALEVAPPLEGQDRRAASDFVRRAVHAWRLLGPGQGAGVVNSLTLAVPMPWTQGAVGSGRIGAPEPRPEVAVITTLGASLANRRVVGKYEAGVGVACFVLQDVDGRTEAPTPRGCLVAWCESGDSGVLEGYFGPGPIRVIDAFGNSRPAPMDASGRYLKIPIGPDPVFIEPVDPTLARLVSGFRIEPGAAPAVIAAHEHELVLDNPWGVPMAGELRVISPSAKDRWEVSPTTSVPFNAPANGQARVPITLSFPPDEESGSMPIVAMLQLRSPVNAPPIRVSAPLTIGLLDLSLTAEATRSPGPDGPDVVVTVTIANLGAHDRTLRLDAMAPGHATAQYSISNLAPGETTIRRFVLKGVGPQLSGKRVRLSLCDVETPERLNRVVTVP